MEASVEVFEGHRPLLLGLAYRLLGSMWNAEDIVQEAYVRWLRTDTAEVREPRAFLVTVVSRLALDQLRSARVARETYTGPWLPEPVSSELFGPLETAELRDTLSYATLHLMELLSPPERAVFVLREAFELPYDDIAEIVQAPAPTCRQLHRRAAQRLAAGHDQGAHAPAHAHARGGGGGGGGGRGRARFTPSAREHALLLGRFLDAAQNGDLAALTELLSDDVVAWNDGGGKTRAALRPVAGRDKVLGFIAGLYSRYAVGELRVIEANGEAALWMNMGGAVQVVTFDIRDGLIHGIFSVLNPDKLSWVHP